MSTYDTETVLAALQAHGATNHCPRCGGEEWTVGEVCWIFNQRYGPISLYCKQCGFLAMHAVEELGLLTEEMKPRRSFRDTLKEWIKGWRLYAT